MMKRMRACLALFLVLALCASLITTAFAEGESGESNPCAEGHSWENGVCTVCEAVCEHTYGEDRICTVCGAAKPDPCAEGHSWENGVCTVCETVCEHAFGEDGICAVCGAAKPDPCAEGHNWENGVCTVCEAVCEHSYGEDGLCTVCGMAKPDPCAAGHSWADGVCSVCGATCAHESYGEDGLCVVCGMAKPVEEKAVLKNAPLLGAPAAEDTVYTSTVQGYSLTVTDTADSGAFDTAMTIYTGGFGGPNIDKAVSKAMGLPSYQVLTAEQFKAFYIYFAAEGVGPTNPKADLAATLSGIPTDKSYELYTMDSNMGDTAAKVGAVSNGTVSFTIPADKELYPGNNGMTFIVAEKVEREDPDPDKYYPVWDGKDLIALYEDGVRKFEVQYRGETVKIPVDYEFRDADFHIQGGSAYSPSYSGTLEVVDSSVTFTNCKLTGLDETYGLIRMTGDTQLTFNSCELKHGQIYADDKVDKTVIGTGTTFDCAKINFRFGVAHSTVTLTDCLFTNCFLDSNLSSCIEIHDGSCDLTLDRTSFEDNKSNEIYIAGAGKILLKDGHCTGHKPYGNDTTGFLRTGSNSELTMQNYDVSGQQSWHAAMEIGYNSTVLIENCDFTDNQMEYNAVIDASRDNTVCTIRNCTFTDNEETDSHSDPAAVDAWQLTMSDCSFERNKGGDGGAVQVVTTGTLTNCDFTANTAKYQAGALKGGNLDLTKCTFTNNKSESDGGAIRGGTVKATGCTFEGNSCSRGNGGAIDASKVEITDSVFTDNHTQPTGNGEGGAIRTWSAGSTITDSTFEGNTASVFGGAAYLYSSSTVTGCTFTDNTARFGGAVYGGDTFQDNIFTGNQAYQEGGAVQAGKAAFEGCQFSGNFCEKTPDGYDSFVKGGAVCVNSSSFTDCDFDGNQVKATSSAGCGGAIYVGKDAAISGCTFTDNSCSGTGYSQGGAVMGPTDGNLTIADSTFTGNTSDSKTTGNAQSSGGGAIANASSITGSTIMNNRSNGAGGGLIGKGIDLTGNVIYNNHSDFAGDDVCATDSMPAASLPTPGADWILEDCDDKIDGWYVDTSNARWSFHDDGKSVLAEDSVMFLKAAHGAVTITVDPNGGLWEGSETETVFEKQPYNESMTAADPTREGYTFTGWTITKGDKDDKTRLDGTTLSWGTHDVTIQAGWEINHYAITYDPNGGTLNGSTEPSVETHSYGEKITISPAPTREGYKFLYWKGSEYQPGDSYTVTEDHTFVAQWEKNPDPTPTPTPAPTESPKVSPKTGDDQNVWRLGVLTLFALLGGGMAVIASPRRKGKHSR